MRICIPRYPAGAAVIALALAVGLSACGSKPKPPIDGGDSGCKNGPFTRKYAEGAPAGAQDAWRALIGERVVRDAGVTVPLLGYEGGGEGPGLGHLLCP